MAPIIAWLTAHWALVSSIAVVLVAIVNRATLHWSNHAGAVKVLLFVAELLSVLTSRDVPGWLKWPLTSKAPGSVSKPPAGLNLLMALCLMFASCASTPRAYLAKALVATEAADKIAVPAISETCKAKPLTYDECEKVMRAYQAAMDAIGRSLETANKVLADVGVQ